MKKIFSVAKGLSLFAALTLSLSAQAQLEMPQPSPAATLIQKVGMTEIKIEYSRPSAKGRKIFGETVPLNGDLWRTGANAATKFTTTDSITIMGKGLAKGTYVLMTRPKADGFDVIFNKNLMSSASDYKAQDDVLTVTAKPTTLSNKVETFTFEIGNITPTSATIDFMWENMLVSVPFTNDVDKKVMAQIKQKLDGPSAAEYFSMSQYYMDSGKDMKEALSFVNKSLEKGGERYWILRHKSLVQGKLGDKAGALATAKRSLELAKEAKNNDYVRMNEKSIAEWSK